MWLCGCGCVAITACSSTALLNVGLVQTRPIFSPVQQRFLENLLLLPDLLGLVVVIDTPLVAEVDDLVDDDASSIDSADISDPDSDESVISVASESDLAQLRDLKARREAQLMMAYKGKPKRMPETLAPGQGSADVWAAAEEIRQQVINSIMRWKQSVRVVAACVAGRVGVALTPSCVMLPLRMAYGLRATGKPVQQARSTYCVPA